MLFDFQAFIQELKDNPEKKETVEKYEKHFGEIGEDPKALWWYQEYIKNFSTIEYKVPEELKEDFDWDFLMQLIAWSLSSEWLLDNEENPDNPEFVISVQNWDQLVVKKISELWGFQILRLYEIYIEEQMNLQILMAEDEKERWEIDTQRDSRKERWNIILEKLTANKELAQERKEKEEKLSNLMDQL